MVSNFRVQMSTEYAITDDTTLLQKILLQSEYLGNRAVSKWDINKYH